MNGLQMCQNRDWLTKKTMSLASGDRKYVLRTGGSADSSMDTLAEATPVSPGFHAADGTNAQRGRIWRE